jgi:dienelactone hydrolase
MTVMRFLGLALLLCFGLSACAEQAGAPAAGGQARSAGPISEAKGQWRAQDHWIPVEGTDRLILMRLCRPNAANAARLVVVNHGSPPNAAQRPNYAPWSCEHRAISWFLTRGYAVALPLRRGYGASGGAWAENYGSCRNPDFVAGGAETARDIRSALAYATTQPGIRRDGAVVLGQSAGGWGALALAARNPPEVSAIVNMAGGRGGRVDNLPNNNCRADALAASAGSFGQSARVPSLWIYTANDSFFSPSLAAEMHQNYVRAGGDADFRALPAFGQDGHGLFTAAGGPQIWGPLVEAFLANTLR